jgi:hypothetical protein
MPLWIPAIAAGATVALLGKILARHLHGQLAHSATHDPDGIRTVARFVTADPERVLLVVAAELARVTVEDASINARPLEIARDAVRTPDGVDIVRLATLAHGHSLTLTRAWTGPQLDARAVDALGVLHDALVHAGVAELAWYARQDRGWTSPHPHPIY